MKMRLSTNLKFKRILTNILSIVAILAMAFPVTGSVSAQEPTPFLVAFPEWESVEGYGYPLGVSVRLEIDDPSTADITPDYFADGTVVETGWGGNYVKFNFWGEDGYDLKPDDLVSLIYNDDRLTHRVRDLSVTNVDVETDSVVGMADPGEEVFANTYDDWGMVVTTTASSDGEWIVNIGLNLEYNSGGRAQIYDDLGNSTAVDWSTPPPPPNPHFTVFPEWEFFDGLDWPDGAIVSISVEGKPECSLERESWGGFFNGNFPEGCNVEAGDTVTFDDGTTNRWHTVRNLYVTDVDTSENTVTGKADAGETVYVWPHDGWFEPLQMLVDGSGVWQVGLDEAGYTIREDSEGRSEIRDEIGNATASDWHVTHPRFTVFPEWEWFDGNDWANEAMVTITVEGKDNCTTVKESWGYFFNGSFGEGCDIVFGDTVTFTDGETVRTHTVQNLAITKVNQEDNIVKGTADAGAEVYVWPHATGQEQMAITNPQGRWNVDFTGIYDLMPADGGRAEIRDEMGNSTAVDWNISNPRLIAFPAVDQIFGYYWPAGSRVNLSINDKHVAQATVQGAPWDPNDVMAFFDFGALHDLTAGDVVVLSGHDMEINYTVQNLTVTEVNEIENTVTGTADPGAVVMVYPFDYGDQPLQVTADGNGKWFADFEEGGIDLLPGMCGRSDIFDELTNSTTVDWCIPNPTFVAYMPVTIVGYDWPLGDTISININDGQYTAQSQVGNADWDPTVVLFELWQDDFVMEAGDHIVMTDETAHVSKEVWVTNLAATDFDLNAGKVFGTYDLAYDLWVWLYDLEGQVPETDPDNGTWVATFTELPPGAWGGATQWDIDGDGTSIDFQVPNTRVVIANQPDWVNSGITVSTGQSFTIEAFGLMNPCSDTYPNGADYCIFYTPLGAEGVVPDENEFGIFPGPGLRFMALLGRIGDGEPFYIGEGDTFTAEQAGTLWLTPNDNLRTDNQGAYSVLVWLEP